MALAATVHALEESAGKAGEATEHTVKMGRDRLYHPVNLLLSSGSFELTAEFRPESIDLLTWQASV